MTGWTAIILHDGREVLRVPAHPADAASIAAPALVALYGGPISVGAVLVDLAAEARAADDGQLPLYPNPDARECAQPHRGEP